MKKCYILERTANKYVPCVHTCRNKKKYAILLRKPKKLHSGHILGLCKVLRLFHVCVTCVLVIIAQQRVLSFKNVCMIIRVNCMIFQVIAIYTVYQPEQSQYS